MPQLRDYQLEDIAKLKALVSCGNFNEQRTGKTPTTIRLMVAKGCKRWIVVCPVSAQPVWVREINIWAPEYTPIVIEGAPDKRKQTVSAWKDYEVLIVSYNLLRLGAGNPTSLVQCLLQNKPDGIVADEAHRFKNPGTKTAKAIYAFTKIPNRVALSGTPAKGKPEDIFGILKWLLPSRFKNYWVFIHEFFNIRLNYFNGRCSQEVTTIKQGKDIELQIILNDISTQRKRAEVMSWLPPTETPEPIYLEPTKAQKKHLRNLNEYFETEHIVTKGTLDKLIRCRQIMLDPRVLKLSGDSAKTTWLFNYLEEYAGTPVIIFSKFTSYLRLLSTMLTDKGVNHGLIVGDTSLEQRAKVTENFQNGLCDVLLLNIDACKEALTLDRAECTIFTDVFPPVSDLQQAQDRFVATTEARKDIPKRVVYLLLKGTYDERLYELILERAQVLDLVNDYKKYLERSKRNE